MPRLGHGHLPYIEVVESIPILATLAKTIPWHKLLQLLTPRHYSMGQKAKSWHRVPHDILFVVEGQFTIHTVAETPETDAKTPSMVPYTCRPGAVIGARATFFHEPLPYDVVTAKYKSTVLAISKTKFKTVLKQTDAEKSILALIEAQERSLQGGLDDIDGTLPLAAPAHDTIAVEYDVQDAVLVLHEPLEPPPAKPVTNAKCLQTKLNRTRRLESLHLPENYQHTPRHTKARLLQPSPSGVTREKPVGRLLKPLQHDASWYRDANGHAVVHAKRGFACELRAGATEADVPKPGRFTRVARGELSRRPMLLHINHETPLQVPAMAALSLTESLVQSQRPCEVPVLLPSPQKPRSCNNQL
ncbi:hypothetical protein ACHHYP_09493 [Achlya hypogyna]|uniref:Cyclic nucleotide-binding domain-containing protein n=1 Tax=Achlya hypogyna TaxID=1202772 RepID=A0A1V9YN79_ACHHY|nr:hypothetical protein ACHHYP_09493 [Achlya hypogyna]